MPYSRVSAYLERSTLVRVDLLLLLLAAPGLSCAGGGVGGATPIPEVEFSPELGIELDRMTRSSSGLYSMDLEVGMGEEARTTRLVTVHYIGSFPDGEVFESSLASGEPASFTLGRQEVIPGWEEGIRGMREGGRRKLVVPPRLAYGRRGLDDLIPGNAVLVFEVQLLRVER